MAGRDVAESGRTQGSGPEQPGQWRWRREMAETRRGGRRHRGEYIEVPPPKKLRVRYGRVAAETFNTSQVWARWNVGGGEGK